MNTTGQNPDKTMSLPKPNIVKKKKIYTSKLSDRRLAGGKRPEVYLHSLSGVGKHIKQTENWNPKHFRLFVGNLGPEATDEILLNAFSKYESLSKVNVPVDPKTKKNKGFGFVAFASADDYLKAFKEMNGKYVGQRPVQLKRAESKVKK